MKRLLFAGAAALVLAATGALGFAGTASAQEGDARVRVIHASPDAPNVDVYVDDASVLTGVPYKAASDYLPVPAGDRNIKVFAAGADPAMDQPVIDADAAFAAGTDYSVVALGTLDEIRPGVFVDDNSAPAGGKAHVRVIHASPDAPAVDVAVAGGPALVTNLAFGEQQGPLPVDAGTYDLEARPTGTMDVALPLSGVTLEDGTIYTVVAVGLVQGEPALEALTVTNEPAPTDAAEATPAAGGAEAQDTPAAGGAETLPDSGMGAGSSDAHWALVLALTALGAGAVVGATAFAFKRVR